MNFNEIDIIVSEIDGIITNGLKPLDHMNHTMFKYYYERDFEAIKELKRFFTFVFLADDPDVSYNIMRTRNIPAFFVQGNDSKLKILNEKIMSRYNMRPENLLYIGNKISDIPCMHHAEIGFTIPQSAMKVQQAATTVLDVPSGFGVISKVHDILHTEIEKRKRK